MHFQLYKEDIMKEIQEENKQYRYTMSEYTVEIERMTVRCSGK